MGEEFKEFTKNISTKSDLIYFLEEINEAQEVVFEEPDTSLSEKLGGRVAGTLLNFIKQQERMGNLQSRSEQSQFLKDFKGFLQELSEIRLTIAFSPSPEFVGEISNWLEQETGKTVVLDIAVEPEIVGGAIVEYEGRYFSFRLDKKIDEVLNQEYE